MLDEFINAINQSGFQFDSWNLQNGGGGGGVGVVVVVGGGGGGGGVPSHNSPVLEPTISKFGPIMHLNPNLIYVGLSTRVNASHLSKFDLIEKPKFTSSNELVQGSIALQNSSNILFLQNQAKFLQFFKSLFAKSFIWIHTSLVLYAPFSFF